MASGRRYLMSMPSALEAPEVKLGGPNGGGPRDHDPFDPAAGAGETIDGNDGRGVPGAGLLAMRFLLVSISALFATIGVAYYERAQSPGHWQHIHVPPLLWLSTGLILASTWTLEIARGAFERKNSLRYARWLAVTVGDRSRVSGIAIVRAAGAGQARNLSAEQSAQFAVLRADGRARPPPAGRDGRAVLPAGHGVAAA